MMTGRKNVPKYIGVSGSALEVDDDEVGHITALEIDDDGGYWFDDQQQQQQQPKDGDPCCPQLPLPLLVFWGFYSLFVVILSYGGSSNANALMKQQQTTTTNDSSSPVVTTTVEFASRFYMEHNKPHPAIVFSDDQLNVLGALRFQRSILASVIAIPFAVIGCFGMLIPILQSNPNNGCGVDSSSLLVRNVPLILLLCQWIGCAFATASYVMLYQSAICGPYYVELTYERQPDGGPYQQGGDAILHPDAGASCAFGSNFYLSLLGTLMISFATCLTASNWYRRSSCRLTPSHTEF